MQTHTHEMRDHQLLILIKRKKESGKQRVRGYRNCWEWKTFAFCGASSTAQTQTIDCDWSTLTILFSFIVIAPNNKRTRHFNSSEKMTAGAKAWHCGSCLCYECTYEYARVRSNGIQIYDFISITSKKNNNQHKITQIRIIPSCNDIKFRAKAKR